MHIFHIISLDEKTSSMFDLIAVGRKSKWFLCGWAEGGATKGEKTGNQSFAASSMTCYPVHNTNLGGSTAKANLNKSTSCSWHISYHSMENKFILSSVKLGISITDRAEICAMKTCMAKTLQVWNKQWCLRHRSVPQSAVWEFTTELAMMASSYPCSYRTHHP